MGSEIAHLIWTISWQAGLLAAVVWLICRIARKAPASWRYALWLIVLLKFFVPPFIHLPSDWAFWQRPGLALSAASAVSQHFAVFAVVWIAGAGAMAALLLMRGRRQAQLFRSSDTADEDLIRVLMDSALGLKGCYLPQIRLYEKAPTPMLVGLVRPTVLIPPGVLDSCTPTDLRAMLMHELAHIKRRDILVLWLQHLAQVLFFFHPAVWLAARELRRERELACDEMVLSTSSISNQDYASGYFTALKMANSLSRAPMTLGMAEPFEVEKQRLLMIFRDPVPRLSVGWAAALLGVAVLGLPTIAGIATGPEPPLATDAVVRLPVAADSGESAADWRTGAAGYLGIPLTGTRADSQHDASTIWAKRTAGKGGRPASPKPPVLDPSAAVKAYIEESDPYTGVEGEGLDDTAATATTEGTTPTGYQGLSRLTGGRPLDITSRRRVRGGVYFDGFEVTNNGELIFSDDFNDSDITGWGPVRHAVLFSLRRRPAAWCMHLNWKGGAVAEAFHPVSIDQPGVVELSALLWLPPVEEQESWKKNRIGFTNLVLYSGSTEDNIFAGVRLHPGEPGYRVWIGWNNFGGRDGKRWTGGVVLAPGKWARLTLRLDAPNGTASALLNGREIITLPYTPDRFATINNASVWGWLGSGAGGLNHESTKGRGI